MKNIFKQKVFLIATLLACILCMNTTICYATNVNADCYGAVYLDGDSTGNATTAYNACDNMGYNSYLELNNTAEFAYTYLPYSSIYYFQGHGNKGITWFYNNNQMLGFTAKNSGWAISNYSSSQLSGTKLALFLACETGSTDTTYGNLVDQAISKGAKCAIGFTDIINQACTVTWNDTFWGGIEGGQSIYDSCIAATYQTYYVHNSYGNLNARYMKGSTGQILSTGP